MSHQTLGSVFHDQDIDHTLMLVPPDIDTPRDDAAWAQLEAWREACTFDLQLEFFAALELLETDGGRFLAFKILPPCVCARLHSMIQMPSSIVCN